MDENRLERPRLDPRIGYDGRNGPDLERLDEKLEAIEEIPAEAFVRPPRAIRQAEKKVWSKTRKGRAR